MFLRNYVPSPSSSDDPCLDLRFHVWVQVEMDFPSNIQLHISRAMHRNRLAHAILLVDDSELAKQTMIEYFAMALLCGRQEIIDEIITPCQLCEDCLQIKHRRHQNIEWIIPEDSKDIRIDRIREVREHLRLSSFNQKSRLFVLPEAHLLTIQATNALLKSLEEPSKNQYFLLTTSSPSSLCATLLSRCQRLTLRSSDSALPQSQNDNELSQFAETLLRRISGENLTLKMEVIEDISRHPSDKTDLFLAIEKLLQQKIRQRLTATDLTKRTNLLKSLEATTQSRLLLERNVNLQLTLENWLLKEWPLDFEYLA